MTDKEIKEALTAKLSARADDLKTVGNNLLDQMDSSRAPTGKEIVLLVAGMIAYAETTI